ncbi:hypothetical protein M0R72_19985 [Candidatus Pacearchaeota archaeon]|nr:hypothetical protein [Candidatus Pacearchaeota archaeon]
MIGDQILCILRTFGPLPSSAFVACHMKRDTVRNNLSRMKRRDEVRCIPGYQKRNLWEAI